MSAASVALALLAVGHTASSDVIASRAATAEELQRGVYDTRWVLPDTLPLSDESADRLAVDLFVHLRELLARRWDAPAGAPRCVGDVVRAWKLAGAADEASERMRRGVDALTPAERALLRELLRDDALRSREWDPERDDARDGIAFARPLTLAGRRDAPWAELEGSPLVQQACVLVLADLGTIKDAENDYRNYPRRPGSSYESIHPVRGSYVRGADEQGRAFAALRLQFRCDLPFPFGDYACDLAIWNRVGADGIPRCDIHSKSRDFLWLAGSDLYLPVITSDGELVATCIVRRFGFDLRGVPDGDDARRAGLRSSLGSLKLEAEALARVRGRPLQTWSGEFPEFVVRGGR